MNYTDYIEGLSFRFYKPQMPPKGFGRLSSLLRKFNLSLEILNTKVSTDSKIMKERLRDLCEIPRMSTYAIGAMINKGVSLMPHDNCFVNVGVWHGFTLLAGMVQNPLKRCIGVDDFSQYGCPREQFLERFKKHKSSNHYFYDMDYLDYFSMIHKEPIGFYVYDGEHGYENQLKGLQAAEPFFARNCIILIDDTNWGTTREATLDFMADSPYKYQILLDKTTFANRHPTLWNGIIIFQKVD